MLTKMLSPECTRPRRFVGDSPAQRSKQEPPQTATLQYVGKFCEGFDLERRGPFVTGVYCATGFMMIRRCVIDRLIEAYPERMYQSDHVYTPDQAEQKCYALFECMIDTQTREYLSEDFGFCRLWRALGGKIWLDVEAPLVHTGRTILSATPRSDMEQVSA